MIDSTYIDTVKAAEFLGLSPKTLNKLRCVGGGPEYHKLGRCVRYTREDLERWAQQGRRLSTSDPGRAWE